MLSFALPVADMEVSLLLVALLGAAVGVLGGLLGAGGGFILTPMLNVLFGIPYNIAVGSGLSQMVGMSSSATMRHRGLGNIDLRLGIIVVCSAIVGVECGVRVLEFLKQTGTTILFGKEIPTMTLVMSLIYITFLALIGQGVLKESIRTIRAEKKDPTVRMERKFAKKVHSLKLAPMISLPDSGVEHISIWILVVIGLVMGFACGLLGVGGGFIVTPCFIYVIGVPTTIAIGTSLSQIVVLSAYGTFRHSLAGNVDPLLVVALITGSSIGSQIGATLTKKIKGARLRLALGSLLFVAVIFVLGKLISKLC